MWSLAGAARCLAPVGAASVFLAHHGDKRSFPHEFHRSIRIPQNQMISRPVQCSESATLTVITWNILAAPYTKYNWKFHRAGAEMDCELQRQTRARYSIAGRQLIEYSADVVLLQECEAAFFSPDMNSEAGKIEQQYHVLASRIGDNPGTAVLVKRDGHAELKDRQQKKALSVGGDGFPTYVSAVVDLMVGGHPITVASVHVPYWPVAKEQAMHQLKLLEKALIDRKCFIVGGDFNAGTTAPNEHLPDLEANTFFGRLSRAKLAPGIMTGLVGDFSAQVDIDHIYVSQGLGIANSQALAVPLNGGPYSTAGSGPADIASASDHVPVLAYLRVDAKL